MHLGWGRVCELPGSHVRTSGEAANSKGVTGHETPAQGFSPCRPYLRQHCVQQRLCRMEAGRHDLMGTIAPRSADLPSPNQALESVDEELLQ